jgi:hypothetical protein
MLTRAAFSAPSTPQQQKAECAQAFNQGQKLLKSGRLVAARQRFVACSQQTCPRVLNEDCVKSIEQIEQRAPTVIFEAHNSRGADVADVKVSEKDVVLTERLDGQAMTLDPGVHDFHFDHQGQRVDQQIVLREGDKLRHVPLVFDRVPPPASSAPPPVSASASAPPPDASSERSLTPGVIVLGSVGLVASVLGLYLDVKGRSDLSTLRSTCAPGCDPASLDSVKSKLRGGDISLAIGLAALGGATLVYFLGQPDHPSTDTTAAQTRPALGLTPVAGGALGSFGMSF